MTWSAVSACNAQDWQICGKRMADSFSFYWPPDIPLRMYVQGFKLNGCTGVDLHKAAPWLLPWQTERPKAHRGLKDGRMYDFKTDAVRWAPKVAALAAAAETWNGGTVLVWIDADVITYTQIEQEWLDELLPNPFEIAWLDRAKKYPETSVMLFQMPKMAPFLTAVADEYRSGRVFKHAETHDGAVIARLAREWELRPYSLSGEGRQFHHVFANSVLATRMDHLKGHRKALERSPRTDRQLPGGGAYW